MEKSEGRSWAEGLDSHLVQRLWRRALRPGLVKLTQADGIIARIKGMAAKLPLAERLNVRWQPVDEQTTSSPIVFVKPRPFEFNANPATPNESAKATSGKKTGRSRAKGKSLDQAASPHATRPEASGSGLSPAVSASSGADSQTILVQRKAAAAPSTAPMPVVSPKVVTSTPATPNFPMDSDAKADAGKTSKASTPTLARVHSAKPHSASLPLASTEAPVVKPVPVVSPTARVESRLTERMIVASPRVQRQGKEQVYVFKSELHRTDTDAVSSEDNMVHVDADAEPSAKLPLLKLAPERHGYETHHPEFSSSSTVLPIVREHIVTQGSSARIDQRNPLPLAHDTAVAGQQMLGKSNQPMRSTHAAARARHSRQEPVTMPPVQRVNAAQNESGPSAADPPKPPAVDIDGIVNKVERRFMRRLAVEAERRRGA